MHKRVQGSESREEIKMITKHTLDARYIRHMFR